MIVFKELEIIVFVLVSYFFSSHYRVDELKTQLKETDQEKEELNEKIAFKENELVVNFSFHFHK